MSGVLIPNLDVSRTVRGVLSAGRLAKIRHYPKENSVSPGMELGSVGKGASDPGIGR